MMRMIDADALLRKICGDSCGCEPDQCGYLDEYRHERCKAGQYVQGAPTVNGWISVKARLPEYAGWYLVCFNERLMTIAYFKGKSWPFDNHYHTITHWMPLPERPKETEQ